MTWGNAGPHSAEPSIPEKDEAAAMIGLGVPGRPIRFLVAEDRAPEGVRDRMGPEPALLTELLTRLARGADGWIRTGQPSALALLHQ
jgi:hypothetical protein